MEKTYRSYTLIMDEDVHGRKIVEGFNRCIIIDKYHRTKASYYAKGTETAMIRIFKSI